MLFFERRMTEVISGMQPKVKIWRSKQKKTSKLILVILGLTFIFTAYGAYFWILDPSIRFVSLFKN